MRDASCEGSGSAGAGDPAPDGWLRRRLAPLARLPKPLRRVCILLLGLGVIGLGVVISPLPGPGLSVLGPLGLAVLATEFVWARRLGERVLHGAAPLRARADVIAGRTPLWAAPAVLAVHWGGVAWISVVAPVHPALVWLAGSLLAVPLFYWAGMVIVAWRRRRAGAASTRAVRGLSIPVCPPAADA